MKAYAGGGAKQPPFKPAPVTITRPPPERKQTSKAQEKPSEGPEENYRGFPGKNSGCPQEISRGPKENSSGGPGPAVRKGFFGSSRGAGTLYGDEGSREGEGERKKKGHKADRDFERLVALADPDMGIGGQVSLLTSARQ